MKKMNLNEGLRRGDLRDLVEDGISIDRYRSKMGTDDEVVVLAFKCMHKESAKDLVEFIESGYDWVLDANQSPATDRKGKVTVFVEFIRRTNASNNIMTLLKEVSYLSGNDDWKFSYYKNEFYKKVDEENLKMIPISPKEYRNKLMEEQELDAFMKASGLDPSSRYKNPPKGDEMYFMKALVKKQENKKDDK